MFDFSRTFRGVNTDFSFNFSDIFLISPTLDPSDFLLNRAVRAVTDPHDIIEILLKVVLNTISITPNPYSLPVLGFPMPYVVGFLCSIV